MLPEQTYSAVALDLTDPDQPEGETNGSLLSQSEFTEFYIALPPQNFAKGCKLTFIDTRNRYMGTLTSKPLQCSAGAVRNLPRRRRGRRCSNTSPTTP